MPNRGIFSGIRPANSLPEWSGCGLPINDGLPVIYDSHVAGGLRPGALTANNSNLAIFNVMDYGAVGDGVHDDYGACQAAIAAAELLNPVEGAITFAAWANNTNARTTQSWGAVVYFPPGVYFMESAGLVVSGSGITLQGAGTLTTVLRTVWNSPIVPITVSGAGAIPYSTAVSSVSSGAAASVGTLNVASTASFATSGEVFVFTLQGSVIIKYTNKTSTSFTGCTVVGGNPSFTMTTGSLVYPNSSQSFTTYSDYVAIKDLSVRMDYGAGDGGWQGAGVMTQGIHADHVLNLHLWEVGIYQYNVGLYLHEVADLQVERLYFANFNHTTTPVYGIQLDWQVYSAYFAHIVLYTDHPQRTYPYTTPTGTEGYGVYGAPAWSDMFWHDIEFDDWDFGIYLDSTYTNGSSNDIFFDRILFQPCVFGITLKNFTWVNQIGGTENGVNAMVTIQSISSVCYEGGTAITLDSCAAVNIMGGELMSSQPGNMTAFTTGSGLAGGDAQGNWGMFINGCANISVMGTAIRGYLNQHILLNDSSAVTIVGVTMEQGVNLSPDLPQGIVMQGCVFISCTGNVVRGAGISPPAVLTWGNNIHYAVTDLVVDPSNGNVYELTTALTGIAPWPAPHSDATHWTNYTATWATSGIPQLEYGILMDAACSDITLTGNIIDPSTVTTQIFAAVGATNILTQGNPGYDSQSGGGGGLPSFDFPGTLVATVSDLLIPPNSINLTKLTIGLGAIGTGSTTLHILKNGTSTQTIVVTATTHVQIPTFTPISLTGESDYLQVQIVTPGAGQGGLTLVFG